MNSCEDRQPQLEPLESLQIGAKPCNLVIRDIDDTTRVIDFCSTDSILTPDAMIKVRGLLFDHASKNWRFRLLMYLSPIEVGLATVEAVISRPSALIEVITCHYRTSPFLTAAFSRPEILPSLLSSGRNQEEALIIRLLPPTSTTVGSSVMVFRVAYEVLQRGLELCVTALIGLLLACVTWTITGKVDVSVAVAAAWIQFAQLVQACQRLYVAV